LSTLTSLVVDAGLDSTLAGEGPFTVLAPTDEAFEAAVEALGGLPEPEVLTEILTYHVVPAEAPAADVVTLDAAPTVQGEEVAIEVDGDTVVLNGGQAEVVTTDVEASNGIVHVIDGVLLPPSIVEALAAAEEEAEPEEPEEPIEAAPETVVEFLAEDGRFTALVGAAGDLGLADALTAEGPLTVFAPTDDAFATAAAALGSDAEDTELLTQIVTYHVVDGSVTAEAAIAAGTSPTLQGEEITFEEVDGQVVVAGSGVVTEADVETGNGLVHVVDAVLLPPTIAAQVAVTSEINETLALDPVQFATGSAAIEPESETTLDTVTAVLTENVDVALVIQGHTDDQGDDDANQALSEARAQSVLDALVARGIDAERLTAIGFGETRPIGDNATGEGQAQNRRIEFRLGG
ncbi:MAG: fasciclin domain-containing protein, partial [Actinomycetota bacterium]